MSWSSIPSKAKKRATAALPKGLFNSQWMALPPAGVGVMAGLLCLLTAGVALWSFYENGLRLLKENLRADLRASACVLATTVDPAEHQAFTDASQEASPTYRNAVARLENIRVALSQGANYRFVYTCVRKPEGIYFVLDPTPPGDSDSDGVEDKSHIGDFYPEANPRLRRVFDTGVPDVDEEPVRDSWGSALSGYAPVRDSAGKVIAVAGVDLELTEFDAKIAQLRRVALAGVMSAAILSCVGGVAVGYYHRHLQGTVSNLMTAMDRALAGEQAKSDFMATISHELRTPLNGILGMVALLEETPLNARQREQAAAIHRSGDLLRLIINDILDWSRIESGNLEVSLSAVNLKECLGEIRSWFRPEVERKALTLEVETDPGCPAWFEADPRHLRQVLMHLTGNAVKFTHKGGVRITVHRKTAEEGKEEDHLVFFIKDTGIGVSPEQLEEIFQPFFQADSTSTRHYGGTGLGLAITRRLCRVMGGQISVRSTPQAGSEFTFFIPCIPVDPPSGPDGAEKFGKPQSGTDTAPAPEQAPAFKPSSSLHVDNPFTMPAGGAGPPVLLVSPDRMLIQLCGFVCKRLQQPLEHCSSIDEACRLLSRPARSCRVVLVDSMQLEGTEPITDPAALAATLRGASPQPVRLVALLTSEESGAPGGFDAVLYRRLKMDTLEAVIHPSPAWLDSQAG
ncbi:MAG: Signal transduction histidine kinase [Verrucomicrobiales bacterium]|nr:Signal transduction histidine kinase [Verrucomicrobiales bacterium]